MCSPVAIEDFNRLARVRLQLLAGNEDGFAEQGFVF